jgi:long-subunit acyl-CoA synthetase (AMP-forming)
LKPGHGVGIIGFNSPEWFLSDLGCVFAGGLATGIYPTNSAEACQYVLAHCRANILVVEDQKQLAKILPIRDKLPHMLTIVQVRRITVGAQSITRFLSMYRIFAATFSGQGRGRELLFF